MDDALDVFVYFNPHDNPKHKNIRKESKLKTRVHIPAYQKEECKDVVVQ